MKSMSSRSRLTAVGLALVGLLTTCPAEAKVNPATDQTRIPGKALPYIQSIKDAINSVWPELSMKSYIPAQIEQETCVTLTHTKCFNPKAELKTSREYGFGFGQTTIAYNHNGSERFNTWAELRAQYKSSLSGWTWANRYDPVFQVRAIVLKNKYNYGALKFPIANEFEKMAFTAVYYNSGSPIRDRALCLNMRAKGCDPSKWFDNVEKYSLKSKVVVPGYGKSFYDISRAYPRSVLILRRPKYIPEFDK